MIVYGLITCPVPGPNTLFLKPYSSWFMVVGISPGKYGKYWGEFSITVGLIALIRIPLSSSIAAAFTKPSTAAFVAEALAKFFCGSSVTAPVINVNEPLGII